MTTLGWTTTRIWKSLRDRDGTEVESVALQTLNGCMPTIERVLMSAGTAMPDFTLHDQGHGHRVAERMVDLVPHQVWPKLGTYELALLLLSAYLHDIGMSPERAIVQKHWHYILTKEDGLLEPAEISQLDTWLDEGNTRIELPLARGHATTTGEIQLAEQTLAYYCRHMHNDWSERWIRNKLGSLAPGLYATWIDDLVTLCRSHHDGLHELRSNRFNARIVGTPSQTVNLRYLAALLRMADILEFDPERTPDVILEHRSIAPKSKIYWYKDKDISFRIDGDRLIFAARTPDAKIHRAVIETADAVDDELLCCATLAQEGAYNSGIVPDHQRSYDWPWPARLTRDIAERDARFVYIDGAFRPDARRILGLLSGTALYGSPFAAVRELLQNALDAVREQIARERLAQDHPSDPAITQRLAHLHKVTLTLARDSDGYWLACSDDGVGMTKKIIESHLLVSGSSTRAELRALERSAKKAGFELGRTGQFGIGVLSFFMISDHLKITSRRSDEAGGDPDYTAWEFSIEGINGFGQLTRASRGTKGTEVRLRLRRTLVEGNIDDWYDKLVEYVRGTVRLLPCRLEVRRLDAPGICPIAEPGWLFDKSLNSADVLYRFKAATRNRDGELLSKEQAEAWARLSERWTRLGEKAESLLRWFGPVDGDLSDGLGAFQLRIPYFELPGGASLVFIDMDDADARQLPDGNDVIALDGHTLHSWRGFAVNAQYQRDDERATALGLDHRNIQLSSGPLVAYINWTKGAEIAVHRNMLLVERQRLRALATAVAAYRSLFRRFLESHRDSAFCVINDSVYFQHFSARDLRAPSRVFFRSG
jgi:hypothetical protein